MEKQRILIIESVRDGVCLRRQQNLIRNHDMRFRYGFSYVFCVEPEDLLHVELPETPESIIRDAGQFGSKLPLWSVKTRLGWRLRAQLDAFRPHFVFLYQGFVYDQFRKDINAILRGMRSHHPDIECGRIVNPRRGGSRNQELFGSSEPLLQLEDQIGQAMRPRS